MRDRRITIGILLVTGVIFIVWDLYVAANPTPGDTISEVILDFSRRHAMIPFVFGVLMGHFFWPQKSEKD